MDRLSIQISRHFRIVFLFIALSVSPLAWSEQVLVNGSEEGQGMLHVRNGECFAVTPDHVVRDAATLTVATENRSRAKLDNENPAVRLSV